jgi:hypothetical protein
MSLYLLFAVANGKRAGAIGLLLERKQHLPASPVVQDSSAAAGKLASVASDC